MSNAKHDENAVPTLIGVSSVDGVTPVNVWVDPTTHRLLVDATGGSSVNYGDGIIPSGAVNGSNQIFVLPNTPSPALSLQLFVNGQLMSPIGVDYSLTTATITLNTAPPTGSTIIAWYRY